MTSVNVITLVVEDEQRSKRFYERVFDDVSAVDEEPGTVILSFENLFLRLLTRSEANNEMAGAVSAATSNSTVSFQLALFVEDLDARCAALATLSVPLIFGPVDRPWGVRNAAFRDPDGHVWVLSADIDENAA